MPCRFEAVEISLPVFRLVRAQVVQMFPGIKTAVVAIIENELHRILPNRFDRRYLDVFLAGLQYRLPGAVPPHLGRG